jgi:arsenate reductase
LLNEHQVEHTYREYTREPLNEEELRAVLRKLGVGPHEVLRTRDATKAGIANDISADALIAQMVINPRLLQRPIGIVGERAAIGRPPEALLSLLDD